MNLILFSLALIVIGILLFNQKFGTSAIIPSTGSSITNPIYFSGNKCQRNKKHNMLRISKLRRKK